MHDDSSSKGAAPKNRFLAVVAVAFFGFFLYQAYLNFFGYTGDHLTRHDQRILERAEGGEAHAQFLMGGFRMGGRQALPKDLEAARGWFEKAAAQGYAPAQYRLGALHRHGEGVPKDSKEAARLFGLAAESGDLPARNALAELHLYGEGVEENSERALELFRSAADEGFAPAQRNLGYLAAEGRGMARDFGAALAWYRKAAEQSDNIAMSNLGLMYEHGQGVEADPLRAWDCYYRAGLRGYRGARKHRERIEAKLPAEWHAKGLYERDGRDCLEGGFRKIMKPVSRVRE